MSEWPLIRTGDVFDLINGFAFKGKEFLESGTPVIKIKNVKAGHLAFEKLEYVDSSFLESRHEKVVRKGDLLITMSGNRHDGSMETWVGKVAWFNLQRSFLVNQRVGILRMKEGVKLNPRYVAYQLSSIDFQRHFISVATSSGGQANLSPDQIKNTEICCPPLEEQNKVVEVVGAIEDKIELNRQINRTLEEMAQAIFKSWFVDFEPVKAKILVREKGGSQLAQDFAAQAIIAGNVTLEELEQMEAGYSVWEETLHPLVVKNFEPMGVDLWKPEHLAAIAALFPSTLQDSPLGPIPEGWDVEEIGKHIDAVRGLSYKGAGLSDSGTPLHNLNSIYESGGYKHEGLKYYTLDYKEKHLVKPGDVIVANTEQGFDHLRIGYGAMIPSRYPEGIFSHHLYRIRPKKSSPLTPQFIFHLFLPGRFRKLVAGFTNGTTVNMLPADGLDKPEFVIPNKELIKVFSTIVQLMREQVEANLQQNELLTKTRDALLPKLLSGEISIGAAKAEFEEAE